VEDDKQIIRIGRQKAPFMPIVQSAHKIQIDEKLFRDHLPVSQVHDWLLDQNDDSISYMMLYRYFKKHEVSVLEGVVQENAQEHVQRNWDVLNNIIERFAKQLEGDALIRAGDALAAVKMVNDLLEKHGGIPGSQQVQAEAKRRMNLLVDIVLGIVSSDQRELIAAAIRDCPDLMEWIADGE